MSGSRRNPESPGGRPAEKTGPRREADGPAPAVDCGACVYAAARLDAGVVGDPDSTCGLGCAFEDALCRAMRTANCSLRGR